MQTLTQVPTSNQGFKFQPRFPPPNQQQNQFQKNNFNMQYQFKNYFRPNQDFGAEYDGKRLRKSVMRKTVDYNSAVVKVLESRIWQRDHRDRRALQPDHCYYPELITPAFTPDNPINAVTTKFVRSATNKMRCPIFCLAWTPEGRRLVTGASSGEFTLWNGLTFNFETILQAHDSPVRTMVWSHSDVWMVTGDHGGYIKYWQSNMNNVKMFQAHKEAVRGLSFSPSDQKFATCSDDGTVRIWDFLRCYEERIMRGHGADVKCVEWHPQKGLVVSGSKDNQQPIKLWDPKTGQSIATLHAHKSTVMDLSWNQNGNWLITASRDHLLKLFDIRKMNTEMQIFRGHKKEASSVAWHPVHEGLFCSGGSDGALMFWHVGADKEVGAIEQAHDSIIWALAWHPLGHILCSGSNDHTSKFWTRNRPGDKMRDKYNLNTLPGGLLTGEEVDEGYTVSEEPTSTIPGMGPEDKLPSEGANGDMSIPGLDFSSLDDKPQKKVPFAKPIPKSFQQQWNEAPKKTLLPRPDAEVKEDPMGSLFSQDDKSDSGSKQFMKGQVLMGDVDHRVMSNKFGDQDLRQGDEDKDYRSFRRMEDMDMRFSDQDLRNDDSWGSKRKRMDGGDTDDRWMKDRDSSHFMGDNNSREDNSSFNTYPPQGSRQFSGQGFNMINSQRGGGRSQRGGKSPRLGPWGGRKDSSVNKSGSSGPRPGLLGEHPGDHESGYLRGGMSAVEGVKGLRDDIDYDRSGQGQGTGPDHNKRVSRWSNNDNHFDKAQSRKGDHPSEFEFPRNFESNSFDTSKNRTFEPSQGHAFEGRSSATGTRGGRGLRGNPFYNRGGSSGGSGGFHSRGRGGRGRGH